MVPGSSFVIWLNGMTQLALGTTLARHGGWACLLAGSLALALFPSIVEQAWLGVVAIVKMVRRI